jgi:hypothetical protein
MYTIGRFASNFLHYCHAHMPGRVAVDFIFFLCPQYETVEIPDDELGRLPSLG